MPIIQNMPIHHLDSITLSVAEAAREAGQFIRQELGQVRAEHILEKEKHSLVSYVDIETEKKLVHAISDLVSGAQFITEEKTQDHLSDSHYCWIIDPLDGTTNFLKGIPVFSVSIALSYHGEPVLGVVYDVMHDECFYAWKGGGAYCNKMPIQVSQVTTLDESVIATGFPYKRGYMPSLSQILTDVLHHSRGIRRLGSAAIDLAYTACGRFDGYYETRLNPWDIAGGIVLVQESGGRVSNFRNEKTGILSAHHILATNGYIHEELLRWVSPANLDD